MRFVIEGRLPSLNEMIYANRSNVYVGAKQKRDAEKVICSAIIRAHLKPFKSKVFLKYKWYEKDLKRDADNVVTAQKFIQDALVSCGIIPDDNRKVVVGFSHEVLVDKLNPRIEVEICEVESELDK